MKWLMCGLLIFSAFARADERTDRLEIQGIIDALNNYGPMEANSKSQLFLRTMPTTNSPAFWVWTDGSFPQTHRGRS